MPSRVVTQGNYEAAAEALVERLWDYNGVSIGSRLVMLADDPTLSGGEQALVWFAHQLFYGDIQKHLANLDQDNRRLLVEVLAGFAGVEL